MTEARHLIGMTILFIYSGEPERVVCAHVYKETMSCTEMSAGRWLY